MPVSIMARRPGINDATSPVIHPLLGSSDVTKATTRLCIRRGPMMPRLSTTSEHHRVEVSLLLLLLWAQ